MAAATAVAVAAGALAVSVLTDEDEDAPDDVAERSIAPLPEEPTSTLLVGTRSGARDRALLSWVTLLTLDPGGTRSAAVHIPAFTATEVPGRGPHSLAEAFASGGVGLVVLATENMLGVRVDRHVRLAEPDARRLFRGLGSLEIDVPEQASIPAGDGTSLLFEPGIQALDADALVPFLYRPGEGADQDALGPRHLALWSGLVRRGNADPGATRDALSGASEALSDSDDEPEGVARFLQSFLTAEGRRAVRALPVEPLEAPGDPLYVLDPAEIESFVAEVVDPALLFGDTARVQILNGNGTPGLGREVARKLVGNGFRVALTGNARSLGHRRTLIITYDRSEEGRRVAARARELLGVGEVQVSLQEQGIVDLTIVIGRDFLRAR